MELPTEVGGVTRISIVFACRDSCGMSSWHSGRHSGRDFVMCCYPSIPVISNLLT